jgi:secondary thiamine-phosphate synthase enzyme
METLTRAATCHTWMGVTTTAPTQFLDLTDRLGRLIDKWGVQSGILNVQTLHTTTAIVVNEHEPLLLTDFQRFLEATAPEHAGYRHDDAAARVVNRTAVERANGYAHCRALFLPTSVCLNVKDGRLILGRWQRVFFVELDGPQEREVSAQLVAGHQM